AIHMTRLHPTHRGVETVALPRGPLLDWLKMKNPAAPAGDARSGRGLGEMTRRKSEFVRLTNGTSPIWSNSHFRRKVFAMFCYRLVRSTVNDASQSAAAGVDTGSSHSMFDSVSQTLTLRMHSAIASVASA